MTKKGPMPKDTNQKAMAIVELATRSAPTMANVYVAEWSPQKYGLNFGQPMLPETESDVSQARSTIAKLTV